MTFPRPQPAERSQEGQQRHRDVAAAPASAPAASSAVLPKDPSEQQQQQSLRHPSYVDRRKFVASTLPRSQSARASVSTSQLCAALLYLRSPSPEMCWALSAASPSTRLAVEMSSRGDALSKELWVRVRHEAAVDSAVGRRTQPSAAATTTAAAAAAMASPLPPPETALVRRVTVQESRLPWRELNLRRWWLQRAPRLPIALCAPLVQGQVEVNAHCFDGLARLDVSGATDLLELRLSASLEHLTHLDASGCTRLLFLPDLRSAVNLASLCVAESAVMDVGVLTNCAVLAHIDVSNCGNLTSLFSGGPCPSLRRLVASHSGLTELNGIEASTGLEEVVVAGCTALRDIRPLSACRRLTLVDVSGSGVRDLAPLEACPALAELRAADCGQLEGLRVMPSLRLFDATHSGLACLPDADRHRYHANLTTVVVSHCAALTSLAPLGGAPVLTTVAARFSALRDKSGEGGLGECPMLAEVDLSHCIFLESVQLLAGAVSLRRLRLSSSGVRTLQGLQRCPALQEVDVSGCEGLEDIAALDGAPSLTTLRMARATGVGRVVRQCHKLEHLDITGCSQVRAVEHLRTDSPNLRFLAADGIGVSAARLQELFPCLVAAAPVKGDAPHTRSAGRYVPPPQPS